MSKDAFYVGYQPFPRALAPLYRLLLLPVIAALSFALAFAVASLARPSGEGRWAVDASVHAGRIAVDPYPRLVTDEGSLFLVRTGKRGALDLAAPLVGEHVEATGLVVERGPWRLLEVLDDQALVVPGRRAPAGTGPNAPAAIASLPPEGRDLVGADDRSGDAPSGAKKPAQVDGLSMVSGGTMQTLRGEVMDAKCWLGVMRPGQGKTHRACATLCLIGGIPPLFAVKTPDGYAAYVLTALDGGPAGPEWSAWAGLPTAVKGIVERRDGLTWLRADGGPRRLADADRAAYGDALLAGGDDLCRG